MKIHSLEPDSDQPSDMAGGVTADGYEGWIALESMDFSVSTKPVQEETERRAPTVREVTTPIPTTQKAQLIAQGVLPGNSGNATVVVAAQNAAQRGGPVAASRPTDAAISTITVSKRVDKSSGGIFRWASQDTSEDEAENTARVIEVAQIAMAADGLNFMESVLEFRFEECTPEGFSVTMDDPENGPSETLTFKAIEVTMYTLGSDADGKVDDYYDEATFSQDDHSQNSTE